MIEYLRGKILSKKPLHIILDVQGVGYGIDVPLNVQLQLPPQGHEVVVYVHTHVQQDAIRLYGFATEQDKELFESIISVSGIGPRTTLVIMSELSREELIHAIVTDDAPTLSKVKGIGKKTAERMVLELNDKVLKFLRNTSISASALPTGKKTSLHVEGNLSVLQELSESPNSKINDAIEALVSLDCKRPIAEKAVVTAAKELGSDTELSDLIRLALKYR